MITVLWHHISPFLPSLIPFGFAQISFKIIRIDLKSIQIILCSVESIDHLGKISTIGTINDNSQKNNRNQSKWGNPQPRQAAKDRYDGHKSDQWIWALICDDVEICKWANFHLVSIKELSCAEISSQCNLGKSCWLSHPLVFLPVSSMFPFVFVSAFTFKVISKSRDVEADEGGLSPQASSAQCLSPSSPTNKVVKIRIMKFSVAN